MIGPCTPYFNADDLKAAPDYCAPNPAPAGWDEILAAIAEHSSEVVYALLARQFPGDCTVERRPVRVGGCCGPSAGPFASLLGAGGCADDSIPLWYNPRDITVLIDGAQFDDWHLETRYDGPRLVRHDGKSWPARNDLSKPLTEEGTFGIGWTFGPPTPGIVIEAAIEVGVQKELAIIADPRAKLPPGTDGLNRQGQSLRINQDIERVREAGPAFPSVMTAIAAFNPTNARTPPDVWSPDRMWDLVEVSHPAPTGS